MSSVTVDTNEFSDPHFDPKKWINSVLKPTTTDSQKDQDEDGGAKDTTILVTKLQIASDSTSRQFDQLSSTVIKSMPRILYDLKLIADDAQLTHQGVEAVKENLGLIEGDTEAALEKLRRPHIAKTRMEECRMLLLEKSDHLNKIKQEQEKKREAAEAAEAEAAAAAAAKLLEEEHRKQSLLAEKEEEKAREDQERKRKELEELEAAEKQKQAEEEEQKEIDEALEYGHVQLPPLRQPPPKQRTLQQIQNAATATAAASEHSDDNNSYLQQISDSMTPQVSSVFKRIGVPLDKFWQ